MKLILSSTDFYTPLSRKKIINILNKDIENLKVLFIPNEKATIEKINSNKYYDRLEEYGFKKENIYVFNHLEKDKFINLEIDILYIGGGNTFGTMNKLRKCKFDSEIKKYISNGVIYIGGSCGAHLVTRNIKHVLNFDSNEVNMTNYDGLELFNGILICHYDESRKKIYDELKKISIYPVYKLKDDEVMVVENENITLL